MLDIKHPTPPVPQALPLPVPMRSSVPVSEIGNLAGDIVHRVGTWPEIATAYGLTMVQLKDELQSNSYLKNTMRELRDQIDAGAGDTGLTYRIKSVLELGLPGVAADLQSEDADPSVRGRTMKGFLDYLTAQQKNQLAAQKENQVVGGGTVNVQINVTDGIRGISSVETN